MDERASVINPDHQRPMVSKVSYPKLSSQGKGSVSSCKLIHIIYFPASGGAALALISIPTCQAKIACRLFRELGRKIM